MDFNTKFEQNQSNGSRVMRRQQKIPFVQLSLPAAFEFLYPKDRQTDMASSTAALFLLGK
jgi:hypothetical protein